MPERSNIVYRYDGSYAGLLCCVYESQVRGERPTSIITGEAASLYPVRDIPTNPGIAGRMRASIPRRMGPSAKRLIGYAFLSGEADRETAICDFMAAGYRWGSCVTSMHGDAVCRRLLRIARDVEHEAGQWAGFVRFSEHGGGLVAVIEPKNRVLALIRGHFASRFREERFLIYDRAHKEALLYRPYETRLIGLEHFESAGPDEAERQYRRLWTGYYHISAVESRVSHERRRARMPKRIWSCITELQPENNPRVLTGEAPAALEGDERPLETGSQASEKTRKITAPAQTDD